VNHWSTSVQGHNSLAFQSIEGQSTETRTKSCKGERIEYSTSAGRRSSVGSGASELLD